MIEPDDNEDYDPPTTEEQLARLLVQSGCPRTAETQQAEPPEPLTNGSARDRRGRFKMVEGRTFHADGQLELPQDGVIRAAKQFEIMLNRLKSSKRVFDMVRAIPQMRSRLNNLEQELVAYARGFGWSWQDIADAMQLTRQTVYRRHARDLPRRRSRYSTGEASIGGGLASGETLGEAPGL